MWARVRRAVLNAWRRWPVYRQTPPRMEPEVFYEALLSQRTDIFWQAVEQYAEKASDPETLLKIKRELGAKGYHYMVGYIKGQRDLVKFVNRVRTAGRPQSAVQQGPIRTGGIARYVP